jgi:hypothetical protein
LSRIPSRRIRRGLRVGPMARVWHVV